MILHAIVSGMVQGVFYRAGTRQMAHRLDICGWVKNLENGDVEIMAEGRQENLEELLKWLHKGTSYSKVDNVNYQFLRENKHFKSFDIAY